MELFLDTGNLADIKELSAVLAIDGVTTNPTLVSKEGKKVTCLLDEIIQVIGEDKKVHAQVLSRNWEDMVKEAKWLSQSYKNLYVKVPVTTGGLRAIKVLAAEGVKVTATAVFTTQQAFLAAKAGARYVAPYVNRLDNISANGVATVQDCVSVINQYHYETKVLAASFKNAQQVLELMKVGVHSVTAPADVVRKMMTHPLTDSSAEQFIHDWEHVFGEGTTVLD